MLPYSFLSLSPCTGYQLQLASSSRHWCLHIEQPQAQHPPTSTHYYEFTSPPEVWDLLVSDASWYHHREAQNHSPEHSLSPFLTGGMIFPSPSGMLDPCQFSSNNWKLISFNSTWLHKKKKKKKNTLLSLFQNLHLSLYLSLLPLLVCIYLNNAWDLVLLELPLYVCLFKINRFTLNFGGPVHAWYGLTEIDFFLKILVFIWVHYPLNIFPGILNSYYVDSDNKQYT